MRKPRVARVVTSALFALVTALAIAPPAQAQLAGDGFLFHRPNARLAIRGGYALASAGSDLSSSPRSRSHDRTTSAPSFAARVGFAAPSRLYFTLDADIEVGKGSSPAIRRTTTSDRTNDFDVSRDRQHEVLSGRARHR